MWMRCRGGGPRPGGGRITGSRWLLVPVTVLLLAGCASGSGPGGSGSTSSSGGTASGGESTAASQSPSTGMTPPASAPPGSPPSAAPAPAPADLQALPKGDLPGWKQIFTEDFSKGDVPVGAFPGPAYGADWSAGYKDGTPDTAGQMSNGKSGYYPSKVLSVKDGALNWYLHSENGVFMGAAPTPKIPNSSANPPRANSLLYGRVSVRFKADSLAGYKTAWLFWPDSGIWPRDGEIDFPEGDLADIIYGAAHHAAPQDAFEKFDSTSPFTSWHVATTEWSPGRVEFLLDGKSLGVSTTLVPTTPMHYILQTESCLPRCPAPETQGQVYLDWIAIWSKE